LPVAGAPGRGTGVIQVDRGSGASDVHRPATNCRLLNTKGAHRNQYGYALRYLKECESLSPDASRISKDTTPSSCA
jgi:hypothetical protein